MPLLLGACSSAFLDDREGTADAIAAKAGWRALSLQTQDFLVRAYAPVSPPAGLGAENLTVYIEGDGFAWKSRRQPSQDPTPDDPVALRMAVAQPQGAAVYIARPCQYLLEANAGRCDYSLWTNARYSERVVASMSEAVTALKNRFRAGAVRLVGYSGGGPIAALVAARRDDVASLTTVAANMDTAAWTRHHGVSPLSGSLNPVAYGSRLRGLAQTHLVGERDEIVPLSVVTSYVEAVQGQAEGSIVVVSGMGHDCCWARDWSGIFRSHVIP